MSENIVENIVSTHNGGKLTAGNPGNAGGTGRPNDEFRRKAGEKLDHWLDRADSLLTELQVEAIDFDSKLRVVEAAGKLGERFGKYTGLEKQTVDLNNPDGKLGMGVLIDKLAGLDVESLKKLAE
jgi:hypothetical protein